MSTSAWHFCLTDHNAGAKGRQKIMFHQTDIATDWALLTQLALHSENSCTAQLTHGRSWRMSNRLSQTFDTHSSRKPFNFVFNSASLNGSTFWGFHPMANASRHHTLSHNMNYTVLILTLLTLRKKSKCSDDSIASCPFLSSKRINSHKLCWKQKRG